MFRLLVIVLGAGILFVGVRRLTEELNNAVNLRHNIEQILLEGESR